MERKQIAIIGGGAAGVLTTKCVLEEGMTPICFERTSNYGGLWRFHEEDVDGLASVMKTTTINSSKEMSAFSDFPPPEDFPNYMPNNKVYEYICEFAKKYDVLKHFRFNMEVTEVNMADDYEKTGRLVVTVKNLKTGEVNQNTYDGVMVCNGHHSIPNIPSFPGIERYKGTVIHTHSLKSFEQFKDQTVVIIGVGNSGLDAAVEISSVAKQVYLSTRRGTWVMPRMGPFGKPFDMFLLTRYLDYLYQWLPYEMTNNLPEMVVSAKFDHDIYNLRPKNRILSQHPTVSDILPVKLLSGTVQIKKDVVLFEEKGIYFEKENSLTECDSVILATGYKISFPFLDEKIAPVKDNQVHLFKYIYSPRLKHPTLAIIGLLQSFGGGFPLGEAQIRYAALLMSGKISLPPKEEMEADIQKYAEMHEQRYTKTARHTIQCDYIKYCDELYTMIGAKPNFLKMFFTDPVLFYTLIFGPSLPYQYRLQGPHAWSGARKAIMEAEKRVIKPLKKDHSGTPKTTLTVVKFFYVFALIIISLLTYLKRKCGF